MTLYLGGFAGRPLSFRVNVTGIAYWCGSSIKTGILRFSPCKRSASDDTQSHSGFTKRSLRFRRQRKRQRRQHIGDSTRRGQHVESVLFLNCSWHSANYPETKLRSKPRKPRHRYPEHACGFQITRHFQATNVNYVEIQFADQSFDRFFRFRMDGVGRR